MQEYMDDISRDSAFWRTKGAIHPSSSMTERVTKLVELLVFEPGKEVVLIDPQAGLGTTAMHGYRGDFTAYDIEVLSSVIELHTILGTDPKGLKGNHMIIQQALAARPEAIHALVSWIYRMPYICAENEDDSQRPECYNGQWYGTPSYRNAPQSHPKYVWLMQYVLAMMIMFLSTSLHIRELFFSAPELPGLRDRLAELEARFNAGKLALKYPGDPDFGDSLQICLAEIDGRRCWECLRQSPPGSTSMQKCSICKQGRFCSKECFKENWVLHKTECARYMKERKG